MLFFRVNKLFRSSGLPCPASITIVFPDTGKETVGTVSLISVINAKKSIDTKTLKTIIDILFLLKTIILIFIPFKFLDNINIIKSNYCK